MFNRYLSGCAPFLLVSLCILGSATQQARADERLLLIVDQSSLTTVYDWSSERCKTWDVPDASLRAFRTDSGQVIAFASDAESRRYIGTSLENITHSCHESLQSKEDKDPASFSGLRYLTSLWTDDGISVFGLVHNEYHADHFPGSCNFHGSMPCWYTTIIGAFSNNGGASFKVADPPTVVAGASFRQDVEQGRHRGFFNPSNIIFHEGYFYFASNTTGGRGQKPGLCIFRTAFISDPSSWLAYDGKSFSGKSIDPYRVSNATDDFCAPVSDGTVGSISLHHLSGLFVKINQTVDAERPNGKTVYSWSNDLTHWSKSEILLDLPDMSSSNCSDQFRYGYPSLLDQNSKGRNFDTVGSSAFLFVTRFHVSKCRLTPQRDLVRFNVKIGASTK